MVVGAAIAVVLSLSACAGSPNIVEDAAGAPTTVTSEPTVTSTPQTTPPAATASPVTVEETPVDVPVEVPETTDPEMMPPVPGHMNDKLFDWSDGGISTKYQYVADEAGLDFVLIPNDSFREQGFWAVGPFRESCFYTIWSDFGKEGTFTTIMLYSRYDDSEQPLVYDVALDDPKPLLFFLAGYDERCSKPTAADMV